MDMEVHTCAVASLSVSGPWLQKIVFWPDLLEVGGIGTHILDPCTMTHVHGSPHMCGGISVGEWSLALASESLIEAHISRNRVLA